MLLKDSGLRPIQSLKCYGIRMVKDSLSQAFILQGRETPTFALKPKALLPP